MITYATVEGRIPDESHPGARLRPPARAAIIEAGP